MVLSNAPHGMTHAASEQVRELIQAAVDSYEKLYVLDILAREEGPLSIDVISERARLAHSVVEDVLAALWMSDVVVLRAKGLYEYDRSQPSRNAALSALAQMLEQDPVELSRLMDRAALERARAALHDRLRAGYVQQHLRHHGRRHNGER